MPIFLKERIVTNDSSEPADVTVRQFTGELSDDTLGRVLRVLYRVGADVQESMPSVAGFYHLLSAAMADEVDRRQQVLADLADSLDDDGPHGALLGPADDGQV